MASGQRAGELLFVEMELSWGFHWCRGSRDEAQTLAQPLRSSSSLLGAPEAKADAPAAPWLPCLQCRPICVSSGKGTQIWKKKGAIYEGDWKFGKRDGYGTLSFPDQEMGKHRKVYSGWWKDDKKSVSGSSHVLRVGQAESRLCVCVWGGVWGSSQRGLGEKGGGLRREDKSTVCMGEGRGGKSSRLLRTKPRKQEAGGEGLGRSP